MRTTHYNKTESTVFMGRSGGCHSPIWVEKVPEHLPAGFWQLGTATPFGQTRHRAAVKNQKFAVLVYNYDYICINVQFVHIFGLLKNATLQQTSRTTYFCWTTFIFDYGAHCFQKRVGKITTFIPVESCINYSARSCIDNERVGCWVKFSPKILTGVKVWTPWWQISCHLGIFPVQSGQKNIH